MRKFTPFLLAGLIAALSSPAEAGKELINQGAASGEGILVPVTTRQIPGQEPPVRELAPGEIDPTAVLPPQPSLPREFIPIPDRWRLVDMIGVQDNWWDPYNQNTLKGDRPIKGTDDWFLNLTVISDTVFEPRRVPVGVSPQSSASHGSLDVFGDGDQLFFVENLIVNAALIKGDTTFMPPTYEIRFTPVLSFNHADAAPCWHPRSTAAASATDPRVRRPHR